jgi:hypothetical protein
LPFACSYFHLTHCVKELLAVLDLLYFARELLEFLRLQEFLETFKLLPLFGLVRHLVPVGNLLSIEKKFATPRVNALSGFRIAENTGPQ